MIYLKFYIPIIGIILALRDMLKMEQSILLNNNFHFHATMIVQSISIVLTFVIILNNWFYHG